MTEPKREMARHLELTIEAGERAQSALISAQGWLEVLRLEIIVLQRLTSEPGPEVPQAEGFRPDPRD